MYSNNKITKAVRLAIMLGAGATSLAAMPAFSADAAKDPAAKKDKIERIEVTGSRIKRTDMETSSPIQVTTAKDIEVTGLTRIEDVMNSLPQVEMGQTSYIANGASGTATLDLRGLGPNRTLVLVNGRRLQPGGVGIQAPDINQIPTALVDHVDVMTGGGSSTYGADAVAGVVNFIMKKDFSGFQLSAGAGGYQHNNRNKYIQGLMDKKGFVYPTGNTGVDGKDYNLNVTMGGDIADGKGHVTAYAVWRRNDPLLQGARDYSSCALNGAGTSCGGSANTPNPHFDIFPVVNGAVDYSKEFWGYLNPNGSGFKADDGYRYNYAPVNHFMRPNERFSIGTFANYQVTDNVNTYLETSYMRDVTAGQIAESGTFFAQEYRLDYNNPYMSAAQKQQLQTLFGQGPNDQFVAYIGKRNVEGGPRSDHLEHNSFRIVLGANGDLSDTWTFDMSYQYGSTSSSSTYKNDLLAPKIGPRVGAVGTTCTGSCIPYQVWTLNGVTSAQAAQLAGVGIQNGITTQTVYSAYATGDTDFTLSTADAPVAAVIGVERREVTFDATSDTVYAEGQLLGQGGPTPSLYGAYNVNELYGELNVPLVTEAAMAKSLTLELGGRLSHYNTSGNANTYKVAMEWTPIDDYKFRASFNRAIRAPNVNELFSAQSIGLWSGNDACAGATPGYTQSQCANTGMTAAQYGNVSASPAGQYNQFTGGNPNLQPEKANTVTFGLVAAPFDNFNFSVDYFDIKMDQVIDTVGSQLILNTCAETGLANFCNNVQRSASGSLWLGQQGLIRNLRSNVGGRHWRGVDLSANYSMDMAGGTMNLAMIGSYSLKKEYQPISGDAALSYDCSGNISVDCVAQPKWRHTATATFNKDDWSVTAKWRYIGKANYTGTTDVLAANGINAYNLFDLAGSYYINDNLSVTASMNNIFDKEPPMVGNTITSNANTIFGAYDQLGRYMHLGATLKF